MVRWDTLSRYNLILQTSKPLNFKTYEKRGHANLLSASSKEATYLPLQANSPLERVVRKVETLQIPGCLYHGWHFLNI